MKWIKKGLIIKPKKELHWWRSHTMLPTADKREDDIFRIYFSGRNDQNQSLIGYVEVDIVNDPFNIINYSKEPVLGLGALGCFDGNGVTPSWIINHEKEKFLYYIGWDSASSVRMHLLAGLAVSTNGGVSFTRVSRAPILKRTNLDPYSLNTAPCVMVENDKWRMWYVSGVEWIHKDLPRYNIKYAESNDGINWVREGKVCIDFKSEKENALARPCVIKEDDIYKMWFSYKGDNYRIGYAESEDGLKWERRDEKAGITISDSGWDSQMIEYTFVFKHKEKKYLLYNGNNYGEEGIGLAILDS